jgi:hypothetical protein
MVFLYRSQYNFTYTARLLGRMKCAPNARGWLILLIFNSLAAQPTDTV